MPYLKKSTKKIIFIRIPRTGSTSLYKAFKQDGWEHAFTRRGVDAPKGVLHKKADDLIPVCGTDHGTFETHVKKLNKANLDINNVDYMFTVLRDPIERIESSYRLICKSPLVKEYTYQELYPNYPDTTPITMDEWWIKFKDRILTALWTRSQVPYVTNMSNYPNIDKDFFLYKRETFKEILYKINKKLNIELTELSIHMDIKPPRCLSEKIRREIRDLYINDYHFIDKLF
jgi:hypothetical protein